MHIVCLACVVFETCCHVYYSLVYARCCVRCPPAAPCFSPKYTCCHCSVSRFSHCQCFLHRLCKHVYPFNKLYCFLHLSTAYQHLLFPVIVFVSGRLYLTSCKSCTAVVFRYISILLCSIVLLSDAVWPVRWLVLLCSGRFQHDVLVYGVYVRAMCV